MKEYDTLMLAPYLVLSGSRSIIPSVLFDQQRLLPCLDLFILKELSRSLELLLDPPILLYLII